MLQMLIVVYFLFVELNTGTATEAWSLLLLWHWISECIDQLYSMIYRSKKTEALKGSGERRRRAASGLKGERLGIVDEGGGAENSGDEGEEHESKREGDAGDRQIHC